MVKNILLITGETGAGKDTLADNLTKTIFELNLFSDMKHFPLILWFSTYLKKLASELYDIPLERFYNDKDGLTQIQHPHHSWYMTVREVAQYLSDQIKELDDKCLVRQSVHQAQDSTSKLIIFADWRFPYEIDELRKAIPDAKIRTIRLLKTDGKLKNHNSDKSLEHVLVDLEVDNNRIESQHCCDIVMKRIEIWYPSLFNNTASQ